MKPWRIWLVLLLALLLPLRGAVAAAMLCPAGAHGLAPLSTEAPAASDHGAHPGAHDHHADVGDDAASEPAPGTSADASHTAHGSSCGICAAFCSATPLLSTMPVLPQAHEVGSLRYPGWSAPLTPFLSDGQERPPRRG